MIITRERRLQICLKIYKQGNRFVESIDWAEDMIVDANFEDEHFELLRDILVRIGLADVRIRA